MAKTHETGMCLLGHRVFLTQLEVLNTMVSFTEYINVVFARYVLTWFNFKVTAKTHKGSIVLLIHRLFRAQLKLLNTLVPLTE